MRILIAKIMETQNCFAVWATSCLIITPVLRREETPRGSGAEFVSSANKTAVASKQGKITSFYKLFLSYTIFILYPFSRIYCGAFSVAEPELFVSAPGPTPAPQH